MADVELTKMSSRGQVVIPQEIRDELGLKEGSALVVTASGDTLLLKRVKTPSKEELLKKLEKLAEKGQKIAKKKGIKPRDVLEDD